MVVVREATGLEVIMIVMGVCEGIAGTSNALLEVEVVAAVTTGTIGAYEIEADTVASRTKS